MKGCCSVELVDGILCLWRLSGFVVVGLNVFDQSVQVC